jgi:2-succinyl-6-hydroxy-2,4-cyclohexadiene-1-carboxylate synthase
MAYVTSGSASIYYETYQNGDRPWLVFAHGAGGNATIWWQQIPYFYECYNLVTFDHRTFARSTCPPEDFHTKYFAGDLRAILDQEKIDHASLICQSMGGRTGLRFALDSPERVDALVMSHTIGTIFTASIKQARLAANANRPTPQGPFGCSALAPDFPNKNPTRAYLYNGLSSFNVKFDRSKLLTFDSETRISPEALHDFRVPTLFVTAQNDMSIPPDAVRMAADLVPGAELVDMGEAGHSSYFEIPDRFNQVVGDFLHRQRNRT